VNVRSARILLSLVLLTPAACAAGEDGPRVLPRDPTRPYVITAIDYHFHDAHPTPRLAAERLVIVTNQGRNVHNVTIPEIGYSRDILPGERISLGTVGALFDRPGRHRFSCAYHLDRDMTGVIVKAG
jgi:hypothetical protein